MKQIERQMENCRFIKTILMLCVALGHSFCFWGGEWFTKNPKQIVFPLIFVADWLNSFHIYAFALVSGYLFFYLKFERGKYQNFIPFFINKVKRLLVPFVFVSVIWVIPISYCFFRYGFMEVIKNYLFAIAPAQLWFLVMLFSLFIVFYPFSKFFHSHFFLGAAVALVFYGVGFIGFSFFPNVFQIFRAFMYIPFFWLGFQIRHYGSDCIRKIPVVIWVAIHFLLFLLTRFLGSQDGLIWHLVSLAVGFIANMVGALMAFVVLQKIADRIPWERSKAFQLLSENSMPVYLFHQQIIYVIIFLLNGINPYLHASINFIGSLILSLVISTVLRKFKWTRFLIGEKAPRTK